MGGELLLIIMMMHYTRPPVHAELVRRGYHNPRELPFGRAVFAAQHADAGLHRSGANEADCRHGFDQTLEADRDQRHHW
jgi:hypothetical protein